jgi:RNA polymerase sigma factor (TIGR02999 family)
MDDLTLNLQKLEHCDPREADRILPLVYPELRKLAAAKMSHESAQHTLQPTALVHEVWLRLGADNQPLWQNRAHFFAAAAETMRRILIDKARKRRAKRHGGGLEKVNIDAIDIPDELNRKDDELLAVHEVLDQFAAKEPEKAELVKLRYFCGLTLTEAANALDISEGTAKRWWTYARAHLAHSLKPS